VDIALATVVAVVVGAAVSVVVEEAHSVVAKVEDGCLVAEEAFAQAQACCCTVAVLQLASVASDSPSCISHLLNAFYDYATVFVGDEIVSGGLFHLMGKCGTVVPRERQPLLLCAASPSCSDCVCV